MKKRLNQKEEELVRSQMDSYFTKFQRSEELPFLIMQFVDIYSYPQDMKYPKCIIGGLGLIYLN